jgi:hypothetical protein
MSAREKPMYKVAMEFNRSWLGKHCFAPFTGQDWSAWMAFVYGVELWGRSDFDGRRRAIDLMEAALAAAQNTPEIHKLFVQAIPAVLDWCHVEQIWPHIAYDDARGAYATGDPRTSRPKAAS